MLANVDMLTSAVRKSFGIETLESPPSHYAPLGTKRPAKYLKIFPVH